MVAVFASYFLELVYVCDCLNEFDSDKASFFNSTREHKQKNCVYLYFLNSAENDSMEAAYLHSLNAIQFHMALILTLNLGNSHEPHLFESFKIILLRIHSGFN